MSKTDAQEQPSLAGGKVAWRVAEWGPAVGLKRASVWKLLSGGKIRAVKSGRATLITTTPSEYLASLAEKAA